MDNDDAPKRRSIRSVEIGIRVLEALIQSPSSLPLRRIADSAKLSRSQAHRYLLAYVNAGMVRQNALSSEYELGPVATRLGLTALTRIDVVSEGTEGLRRLVKETKLTGLLTLWGDYGPTIIRWFDSESPLVTSLTIGSALPISTSSDGIVFLAFLPPVRTRKLIDREAARAGVTRTQFAATIAEARAAGYHASSGTVIPGLSSVSAPIRDLQGHPAAVLTLIQRVRGSQVLPSEDAVKAIVETTKRISLAIGWRADQDNP